MSLQHSPPLVTTCGYDPSCQVEVRLGEPLRGCMHSSGVVMADYLAKIAFLDVLLRKNAQAARIRDKSGRKISFGSQDSKADVLSRELIGLSAHLPSEHKSLKDDLDGLGISRLAANASNYLAMGRRSQEVLPADMDGYLAEVSFLHQLSSLCDLLSTEANFSSNHKYVAHQVVLLYQSLKQAGDDMAAYKKSVEQRFDQLKASCASAVGTAPPQLTEPLRQWLTTQTKAISRQAQNIGHQSTVFPHLEEVLQLLSGQ